MLAKLSVGLWAGGRFQRLESCRTLGRKSWAESPVRPCCI
jgi:hypothetical protein